MLQNIKHKIETPFYMSSFPSFFLGCIVRRGFSTRSFQKSKSFSQILSSFTIIFKLHNKHNIEFWKCSWKRLNFWFFFKRIFNGTLIFTRGEQNTPMPEGYIKRLTQRTTNSILIKNYLISFISLLVFNLKFWT